MKKVFLAIALIASLGVNAQILNVGKTTKVEMPENVKVSTAQLSHDGKWAVISQQSCIGLDKVDLATSQLTRISDTGLGFDLKIAGDNKTVIYRESTIDANHRRFTTLKSVNIANGVTSTVSGATRNTFAFAADAARVLRANAGSRTSEALRPVASINRGSLCVTINGVTNIIAPQGTEGQSYLWPSVSPDGKKVLYFLVGEGAFVCNLDGSNPVAQGVLRAPVWYNNNIIVGMDHHDDGTKTTSSKLIAKSIDSNTTQVISNSSVKAMYPSVGANNISFVTPSGELYLINIKE